MKRFLGNVALVICVIVFSAMGVFAEEMNKPAPDFDLKSPTGEPVSLASFKGKGVILNFWATWCPPCRKELPALQKLSDEWSGKNVVVLGMNYEQVPETVADFMKIHKITYPVAMDRDGAVADKYSVRGLPTTFFINETGTITGVHEGPITSDELDKWAARIQPKGKNDATVSLR